MDPSFGGPDPLATDVVASAVMGFDLKDVRHLELSSATGIGQGDIAQINIINKSLFETRKKKLTCELLDDYHRISPYSGEQNAAARRAAAAIPRAWSKMLYRDHSGKGGFTILMGRGIDKQAVNRITGRVHNRRQLRHSGLWRSTPGAPGQEKCYLESGMQRPGTDRLWPVQTHANQPGQFIGSELQSKPWHLFIMTKLKGSQANIVPLI